MKFPHSNCCFFCYSAVFGNYSATSPNCTTFCTLMCPKPPFCNAP